MYSTWQPSHLCVSSGPTIIKKRNAEPFCCVPWFICLCFSHDGLSPLTCCVWHWVAAACISLIFNYTWLISPVEAPSPPELQHTDGSGGRSKPQLYFSPERDSFSPVLWSHKGMTNSRIHIEVNITSLRSDGFCSAGVSPAQYLDHGRASWKDWVAFLSMEQDKLTEIPWLITCAREEIDTVDTMTRVVFI